MSLGPPTLLVIPCYNEASRLDAQTFLDFLETHDDVGFLFVNDGSSDDTAGVINRLKSRSERIRTLHLDTNSGKAEAVRQGMLRCAQTDCEYAGYWDADLSTPLSELTGFRAEMDASKQVDIVAGARIKMVGRQIERSPYRHYSGRAFATAVSLLFGIEMYDTQCGAKLFRLGPETKQLFATPFHTRWTFDVELFVRFTQCEGKSIDKNLVEVPLSEWRDVAGSKMRPFDFIRAPLELLRIHYAYFGSS